MVFHRVRPGLHERVPGPPYDFQAAFVRRWREEHPDKVWADWWQCPLCSKVIQSGVGGSVPEEGVTLHQIDHGPDWLAYQAAGTANEDAS